MTEIKYHSPRLPDEEEVTEVYFEEGATRGTKHIGSVFFRTTTDGYELETARMHGTRDERKYVRKAARRLIREKNATHVVDPYGVLIAKLDERDDWTLEVPADDD